MKLSRGSLEEMFPVAVVQAKLSAARRGIKWGQRVYYLFLVHHYDMRPIPAHKDNAFKEILPVLQKYLLSKKNSSARV